MWTIAAISNWADTVRGEKEIEDWKSLRCFHYCEIVTSSRHLENIVHLSYDFLAAVDSVVGQKKRIVHIERLVVEPLQLGL